MHKSFYASGFLYHLPSNQILLRKLTKGDKDVFLLFRRRSFKNYDPQTVFLREVETRLETSISSSSINTVYDYIHSSLGEHYIFYVELKGKVPASYQVNNLSGWFPLAKLSKYPMSEQTRHDIVIGERVIRSLVQPPPEQTYATRH